MPDAGNQDQPDGSSPVGPSFQARLVAVLALEEEDPDLAELAPYLADPEPSVRRTALRVLTEAVPPGTGGALAGLLDDPVDEVRAAAIEGLHELREVVEVDAGFVAAVGAHARSPHVEVRAAVTRVRWEHRVGTPADYAEALADPDPTVRREAVAGLVSLDDVAGLRRQLSDDDPLVRLSAVRGLARVGDPAGSVGLDRAADDSDLRVRAAAVEGLATLGCASSSVPAVLAAAEAGAWEMRKAAAQALGSAVESGESAVDTLLVLAKDGHIDVRKAAVQALARWLDRRADQPKVRDALAAAQSDPDSDVRGYARLGLGA